MFEIFIRMFVVVLFIVFILVVAVIYAQSPDFNAINQYCLREGYDAGYYENDVGYFCFNYVLVPEEVIEKNK